MELRKFLAELRRRNIHKIAAGYAAGGGLIMAAMAVPGLHLPDAIATTIVVLVFLCLPIALIVAWFLNRASEGTNGAQVPATPSNGPRTRKRLIGLIIGVVLCVAAVFVYQQCSQNGPKRSIAVLPFENLNRDEKKAVFADGIHAEILSGLGKVHDLHVISRTSVMSYRGAAKSNLRQIAKELGVTNIVEGSVRGEDNRVIVNVELIDARNDRVIWQNHYDRRLEDSLGLQGELAGEIASELHVTLSPEEKVRMETKPTEIKDAYVLYLKASGHESNPDRFFADYFSAEQLYRDAIQADPSFALAHARLSATIARIYHWYDTTDERKSGMKAEAERALQLRPDLGEGHFALGLCYYYGEKNYDKALEEFAIAGKALPNDSEVRYFAAAIRRRRGQWKENIDLLKTSQELDPRNPSLAEELGYSYRFVHQWPEAKRMQERWVELAPESTHAKIDLAYTDFWAKGSIGALKKLLAETPAGSDKDGLVSRARWDLAMIERDYDAADAAMMASSLDRFQSNGQPTPKSFYRGSIALARGDRATARKQFELALPSFEEAVQQSPGTAIRHANLGLLYSFMGHKEEAIREGRRAVELLPESKDALDGSWMSGFLAMIYARVGQMDSALPLLKHLLTSPGYVDYTNCSITYNDLRKRWQWDLVRDDPRFQNLLTAESHTASGNIRPQLRHLASLGGGFSSP